MAAFKMFGKLLGQATAKTVDSVMKKEMGFRWAPDIDDLSVEQKDQLLCMLCRMVGHYAGDCGERATAFGGHDAYDRQMVESFAQSTEYTGSGLCSYCRDIDLVKFINRAHMETIEFDNSKRHNMGGGISTTTFDIDVENRKLYNLGPAFYIKLFANCALCRLFFRILPGLSCVEDTTSHYQPLSYILKPEHSFRRLGISIDLTMTQLERYALVVDGWAAEIDRDDRTVKVSRRGWDAFGLATKSAPKSRRALSVRRVDNTQIDCATIRSWIEHCEHEHGPRCNPTKHQGATPGPRWVIDVLQRKVVSHASTGYGQYYALSYVWGGQSPVPFTHEVELITIPRTIEDGMVIVRQLGGSYLWADLLCINQGDRDEVAEQVSIMDIIYIHSYATIVALSASRAGDGISLLQSHSQIRQASVMLPGGQELLSIYPPLKDELQRYVWSKRGWTFQEALLSSRCIFFSSVQIFFQCNQVVCCQSLDESESGIHQDSQYNLISLDGQRRDEGETSLVPTKGFAAGERLGRNEITSRNIVPFNSAGYRTYNPKSIVKILRDLPNMTDSLADPDRFDPNDLFYADRRLYENLIRNFSHRNLTYDGDAINAVRGILQQLQKQHFPSGFYWGLPKANMRRGLGWRSEVSARLDENSRRIGFPSWSWAGWKHLDHFNGELLAYDDVSSRPLDIEFWEVTDEGVPKYFREDHFASAKSKKPETLDVDIKCRIQLPAANSDAPSPVNHLLIVHGYVLTFHIFWVQKIKKTALGDRLYYQGGHYPDNARCIYTIYTKERFYIWIVSVENDTIPSLARQSLAHQDKRLGIHPQPLLPDSNTVIPPDGRPRPRSRSPHPELNFGIEATLGDTRLDFLPLRFWNFPHESRHNRSGYAYLTALVLEWKGEVAYRCGVCEIKYETKHVEKLFQCGKKTSIMLG